MAEYRRFQPSDNPELMAEFERLIKKKRLSRADLFIILLAIRLIPDAEAHPVDYVPELRTRMPSLLGDHQVS